VGEGRWSLFCRYLTWSWFHFIFVRERHSGVTCRGMSRRFTDRRLLCVHTGTKQGGAVGASATGILQSAAGALGALTDVSLCPLRAVTSSC
jgi:hypothetical protein